MDDNQLPHTGCL